VTVDDFGDPPTRAETPEEKIVSLLGQYEAPLANYLRILLRDDDLVVDCAQDTFLRAYENLRVGREVNSQWLYKVARNRAIDDVRHRQRVRSLRELPENTAAQDHGESDRSKAARRALGQLPSDDREILYLFLIDKFSTTQIAAMLGIRAGAVRVRLSRARERFRNFLRSSG